ncbi:MAG: hypothetical protein M3253_01005, partial [Chloroflexota bacterium]|nr:hypothetical protein [Chloroflexota bacterium]
MSENSLAAVRPMVHGLRSLRVAAPARLLPAVGQSLGLDHGYAEVDGPIGRLFVAFGPRGISLIGRAGDAGAFEHEFESTFGRPVRRVAHLPPPIRRAVAERIAGRRARAATVPLDLGHLPEFERSVLLKTLEIPRGEVRPYAWVAAEIG